MLCFIGGPGSRGFLILPGNWKQRFVEAGSKNLGFVFTKVQIDELVIVWASMAAPVTRLNNQLSAGVYLLKDEEEKPLKVFLKLAVTVLMYYRCSVFILKNTISGRL